MPPPRRKPAPAGERVRALPPSGVLDWSDSSHFMHDARPCRYCGAATHLRDATGPADKVCAELALGEIDQIVQVYAQGRL